MKIAEFMKVIETDPISVFIVKKRVALGIMKIKLLNT
jgi:hypothetical protein